MTDKIVQIARYQGMSHSWNLNLFSGPKWALQCGHCRHSWRERIPLMDYPTVTCPRCHTVNRIPIVIEKNDD